MNSIRPLALCVCLLMLAASVTLGVEFNEFFEDATLRVDFYQSGNADDETVTIDRLIKQGRWAGPTANLEDPHPYGSYVVRAIDPTTDETLYELRFDSLFGEYRSTGPAARGVGRAYHESALLPYPKHPIRLEIGRRTDTGDEVVLLGLDIDPGSVEIAVEPPRVGAIVVDAHVSGEPHSSLDIAIVGEGYTSNQIDVFRSDIAAFAGLLISQEPYAGRREQINIRGVVVPSTEEGCDQPTRGIWRATSVGASFNTLGSPRYLLTESNKDLRDIASNVPYDTLVVMVNHDRYGGGGIYNRYCTFTAHGAFSSYLLLHEFGHSFSGLADEYYTSSTAYEDFYPEGAEPIQPNITAATDRSEVKWADLINTDTPVPTPWNKEHFDTDDLAYQEERRLIDGSIASAAKADAMQIEMEALNEAAKRHAEARVAGVDDFMENSGLMGAVGAFEGAGYLSQGLYRPAVDCLMFSRGIKPLCPVCRRAVASRIDYYGSR